MVAVLRKDFFLTQQSISTKYNERRSAEISIELRAQQLRFVVACTQGAVAPPRSRLNCFKIAKLWQIHYRVRREREQTRSRRIEENQSRMNTVQGERGMTGSRVHWGRPPAPLVRHRLGRAGWCAGARGEEGASESERESREREGGLQPLVPHPHRRAATPAVASSHGRDGGRGEETEGRRRYFTAVSFVDVCA